MNNVYQEVELTTVKAKDSLFQEKVPNDLESIQNLINEAEAILKTFDWWGRKYHPFRNYLNELDKNHPNLATDLQCLINILKLNSCLESIFFLDAKYRIDSIFSKEFSYFSTPDDNTPSLSSVLNDFINLAIFNDDNSPAINYDAIEKTLYWDIWLKKLLIVGMLTMITLAFSCLVQPAGPILAVIFTFVYSVALTIGVKKAENTFKEWDNQLDNIIDLVNSIQNEHQDPPSRTLSI